MGAPQRNSAAPLHFDVSVRPQKCTNPDAMHTEDFLITLAREKPEKTRRKTRRMRILLRNEKRRDGIETFAAIVCECASE
jgi:hypothetical protein